MQLIINFLQVISEALSSLQGVAGENVTSMAKIAEWLAVAVDIGNNMLAWAPTFLRDVMGTVISLYAALRLFGRD